MLPASRMDADGPLASAPLNCLVTGASGYVGGRLVPELLAAGYRVRCLARTPGKLRDHPWAGDVEVVRGDVTDEASVRDALRGMDVAYYLVHALGSGGGFEETDRRAARVFARQAADAGVRRVVYLGGLTPRGVPEASLSPHLRSRVLWKVIEGIGGDNGWYSFPLAWAVRGRLDRFAGGVGLRRGRRDAERLRAGDSLDFWRVEEIEPGRLLRLRAEMRMPGLAWLEMYAERDDAGRTRYRQRALFHPRGLLGHAYWWSVFPFHRVVFGGMARNITRAAAGDAAVSPPPRPR